MKQEGMRMVGRWVVSRIWFVQRGIGMLVGGCGCLLFCEMVLGWMEMEMEMEMVVIYNSHPRRSIFIPTSHRSFIEISFPNLNQHVLHHPPPPPRPLHPPPPPLLLHLPFPSRYPSPNPPSTLPHPTHTNHPHRQKPPSKPTTSPYPSPLPTPPTTSPSSS